MIKIAKQVRMWVVADVIFQSTSPGLAGIFEKHKNSNSITR
jgi:hypothetical protein